MRKRELYLAAFRDGSHLYKKWVIAAFSVVRHEPQANHIKWDIRYLPDRTETFNGEDWEVIEDVEPMQPVFVATESIDLKAGDVPNLHQDTTSTYGVVLFNWRVLVYAFGSSFEFVQGPVNIGKIEARIAELMVDDVPPGEVEDESVLYVRKYLRFGQAIADLGGFTQLWVPAASPKALQTHPDAPKLRAELLEKYKDRLHDPAVIAEIQNALVALDKEWLKGDPVEGFFLGDKVWNTARKRMFTIHGPESGFEEGGDAELIVNSLDEGWDITKMPVMVNSLRAGSYYRGAMTALGGEAVKFFMRIFQNTQISEKDCGSTLGIEQKITPNLVDALVGFYQVTPQGPQVLTKEILNGLVGKTIRRRSPMYCKTGLADFCEVCMGDKNASIPTSMGSLAAKVGSDFMYIMMKAAHAKELKTAKLRTTTFLT